MGEVRQGGQGAYRTELPEEEEEEGSLQTLDSLLTNWQCIVCMNDLVVKVAHRA